MEPEVGNRASRAERRIHMTRTIPRALLVVALAAMSLHLGTQSALGCSCMEPDAADLLANSDAAFVGTLVAVPDQPAIGAISSADQVPYVFEIQTVYKGELDTPITVYSSRDSASCGLEVGLGNSATLFVDQSDDGWRGSLCSTMGPEALADGTFEPLPFGQAPEPPAQDFARWALLGVGAVAGAAVGLSVVRARRGRRTGP